MNHGIWAKGPGTSGSFFKGKIRRIALSQRESKWEELLNSLGDRFMAWLNSDEPIFQINSNDFRNVKALPVRLIPTYSAQEIPEALRTRGLEHFRNLDGGCVLIKKEKFNLPTLFPNLNCNQPPVELTLTMPKALEILRDVELHNEETGIILLKEFNLINDFLDDPEEFKLGGRIKTKVTGRASVAGVEFEVKTQLEVDNFLESESRIITIEAKLMKGQPRESFSLHQFALPTLLLCQRTQKPISSVLLEYQPQPPKFRLFHYRIAYEPGIIYLDRYSQVKCAQYSVRMV